MKRLVLLLMVMGFMFTTMPAESNEVIEKVSAKYPAKAGVYYKTDEGEWDAVYGVTIKEKLFIDNVDLALYHDGDETVLLGADLNVPITKNTSIGIGLMMGLDRIESFSDMGEARLGPSVVVKLKF